MARKVYKNIKSGRKSTLNDDLFMKIKDCTLKGLNYQETAKEINISEITFYDWTRYNYMNICDRIDGWRRDRKLMKAERNIEDLLDMDETGEFVTKDGEIVRAESAAKIKIKADISQFVSETLGKNNGYSKRVEATGKDGGAIQTENKTTLDFKDKTNDELQRIINEGSGN